MNRGSKSRAGVFLLEFTIVLLIFSLSSTVAIRLFTKSAELQSDVLDLDSAVSFAQSRCETLKACDGSDRALTEILGENETLYMDENFSLCLRDDAVFSMRTDLKKEDSASGRFVEGKIAIQKADSTVYELPFGIFYPLEKEGFS